MSAALAVAAAGGGGRRFIAVSKMSVIACGFSFLMSLPRGGRGRGAGRRRAAPGGEGEGRALGFEMPFMINISSLITAGANAPGIAMLSRNAGARAPVRNMTGTPAIRSVATARNGIFTSSNRALPNHSFRSRSSLLPLMVLRKVKIPACSSIFQFFCHSSVLQAARYFY